MIQLKILGAAAPALQIPPTPSADGAQTGAADFAQLLQGLTAAPLVADMPVRPALVPSAAVPEVDVGAREVDLAVTGAAALDANAAIPSPDAPSLSDPILPPDGLLPMVLPSQTARIAPPTPLPFGPEARQDPEAPGVADHGAVPAVLWAVPLPQQVVPDQSALPAPAVPPASQAAPPQPEPARQGGRLFQLPAWPVAPLLAAQPQEPGPVIGTAKAVEPQLAEQPRPPATRPDKPQASGPEARPAAPRSVLSPQADRAAPAASAPTGIPAPDLPTHPILPAQRALTGPKAQAVMVEQAPASRPAIPLSPLVPEAGGAAQPSHSAMPDAPPAPVPLPQTAPRAALGPDVAIPAAAPPEQAVPWQAPAHWRVEGPQPQGPHDRSAPERPTLRQVLPQRAEEWVPGPTGPADLVIADPSPAATPARQPVPLPAPTITLTQTNLPNARRDVPQRADPALPPLAPAPTRAPTANPQLPQRAEPALPPMSLHMRILSGAIRLPDAASGQPKARTDLPLTPPKAESLPARPAKIDLPAPTAPRVAAAPTQAAPRPAPASPTLWAMAPMAEMPKPPRTLPREAPLPTPAMPVLNGAAPADPKPTPIAPHHAAPASSPLIQAPSQGDPGPMPAKTPALPTRQPLNGRPFDDAVTSPAPRRAAGPPPAPAPTTPAPQPVVEIRRSESPAPVEIAVPPIPQAAVPAQSQPPGRIILAPAAFAPIVGQPAPVDHAPVRAERRSMTRDAIGRVDTAQPLPGPGPLDLATTGPAADARIPVQMTDKRPEKRQDWPMPQPVLAQPLPRDLAPPPGPDPTQPAKAPPVRAHLAEGGSATALAPVFLTPPDPGLGLPVGPAEVVLQAPASESPDRAASPLPLMALPRHLPADIARAATGAEAEERVELLLDPVELGRLRFEIQTGPDRIEIFLAVERPETLELLRRNMDLLRNEFREAGFGSANLSFGHWGQGGDSRPDTAAQPGPAFAGQADDPTIPAPVALTRPAAAAGAGLDLRL